MQILPISTSVSYGQNVYNTHKPIEVNRGGLGIGQKKNWVFCFFFFLLFLLRLSWKDKLWQLKTKSIQSESCALSFI